MGEKYELKFLSSKNNENILLHISKAMSKYNWLYNTNDYGKYSYWKDEPIWKFGESVEVVETEKDEYANINKIDMIISNISKFYSPSISWNKVIFNKLTTAIVTIVESNLDIRWREVTIAFELNDLIEGFNESQQFEINNELKSMFTDLSQNIKPYYAVSALEMRGLVDTPNQLKISEEMLGDFNYFSYLCINPKQINSLRQKYETFDFRDEGIFIFTTNQIGFQN